MHCWRRLLRVPWTARRSNQSILKKISPEYSLEGLMLKLKLPLATWCKELTHWKRPWCWERLKAGGERDNRGRDGWMASPTRWTWVWASSGSWWWTGKPGMLQSMGCKEWSWLCNQAELNYISIILISIWLLLIINFTKYVPYFVSQCFLRLFLETILTFLFELKNKVEFFSLTKQCDLANFFTTRIGFAKCFAVDISGYWVT